MAIALSGSAGRLVALLAESPAGLPRERLIELARARFRGQPVARITALIQQAISVGAVTESAGLLRVTASDNPGDGEPTGEPGGQPDGESATRRPLRAVIVDLESVVRTTAREPYTEKRIYQLAARRAGADRAWATHAPAFTRWLELPGDNWEIASDRVQAEHAAHAAPAADALAALLEFTADADVIVAYNGVAADFPLLGEACDREKLPRLSGEYVDAYYLALALWPVEPTYRLAPLAAAVGIPVADLDWHDAAADCLLLDRLLGEAAARWGRWPASLRDGVASAVPDSPAWRLVRELAAGGTPMETERVHHHRDIAAIAEEGLVDHRPRRPAAGRLTLHVSDSLRGDGGRVDAGALARMTNANATRRAAQDEMTTALHAWADEGRGGLIEAPTGTGKSLAVLAAALDWLAGSADRTAVISTYTKQLQAQLARDVADLDAAVPGLLRATDVVKGAGNRLSVRALLTVFADATAIGTSGARSRVNGRFVRQLAFRELLVYLLLRLLAAESRTDDWLAHSVDTVDVPPFFGDYVGPALPACLESLSQASGGDYADGQVLPVAAHTSLVPEALAGHRLIVSNHAMLLAHLGDLGSLGDETLLIIDEAHQLEDAATSALTGELDYQAIEDLLGESRAWLDEHRHLASWAAVAEAVRNLGTLLDHEQLPKVAGQAFDARSSGVGSLIGSRAVTLASPYIGSAGIPQVRTLAGLLTRLAGVCQALAGALAACMAANRTALDLFAVERLNGLLTKAATIDRIATDIVADIGDVVGAPGTWPGSGDDGRPSASPVGEDDDYVGGEGDDSDEHGEDDDQPGPSASGRGTGLTNRVVYAEEHEALRSGLRTYRFRILSSPIELPADPVWRSFLATFARTYYVSATLRVAGKWTFLRERLGIAGGAPTLVLSTPFDLREQAELVCFSDFPSWAEQADGAMRTAAHQLAGYAAEMIGPDGRGGFDGGAMVLTTARSAAGGIADYLSAELGRRGDRAPIRSALVTGNQRAVQAFTDPETGGGLLVGTRGLWQGVDVADDRRLRLVWINKLPFAPFAAPVIEARREAVKLRAELGGAEDPDAVATETYYLPLAALQLQQAVGRLIRSERHRGVIVISDRKLAGSTALRRAYRTTFLGSLDPKLLRADPETGEPGGGNVVTMAEGWQRIWAFFARNGLLDARRAGDLSTSKALEAHTLLPQTRRIRALALTSAQVDELRASGRLAAEVLARAARVAGLLRLSDDPADLKPSQLAVIGAVAEGRNVLGLLPTGFGKSFCFQLPALVLPGVTIVVSPLVALMHDQALELNRSIGGAVRALVAPLRESSSRAGKTEVADQLLGRADHGIRLVYVSPERLCQRRFRELVRESVAAGIIQRIALDEAHTFVQWGDDFRPSFHRVERFLGELRAAFGLPVTALTATANRVVHAGLREGVFGLDPSSPGDRDDGELVTVRENPIRPEIAIFRRTMGTASLATVDGLVEEVLDALDDHAIFYCLTVKEVIRLHAHLREYLGDAGRRILRFHGRLTEAEKSAVMTEFREAPRRGEEGFVPVVVVATSAFGLGINRPDIRTVFCVSPATDLAALYQQLGRAGRDAAARGDSGTADQVSGPANTGLTLLTSRGLRTVAFMTGQDISAALLHRMAQAVLSCHGVLDTVAEAQRLIGQDLAGGRLTTHEAGQQRTVDAYATGLVRALAALADLGAVSDLGDFPPVVTLKPGELFSTGPAGADPADAGETAVVKRLLALPARRRDHRELQRTRLDVARAGAWLAATVPGFRHFAADPPATWQLLADLHDRGLFDVSAAPSRRLVTGVAVHGAGVPAAFAAAVSGKAVRAAVEIDRLRDFFTDTKTCANVKFADYFEVAAPEVCCTTAENRCSTCWDFRTDWPPGEREPATGQALLTVRPRPAGWRVDAAARARRLDEQVRMLLWAVDRGLSSRDVHLALRGQDAWFFAREGRWIRLRPSVVSSRFFGANPSVTLAQVEDSLGRLAADGQAVPAGRRWREAGNVARQRRRLAVSVAGGA